MRLALHKKYTNDPVAVCRCILDVKPDGMAEFTLQSRLVLKQCLHERPSFGAFELHHEFGTVIFTKRNQSAHNRAGQVHPDPVVPPMPRRRLIRVVKANLAYKPRPK
jgi:hypothetical protein